MANDQILARWRDDLNLNLLRFIRSRSVRDSDAEDLAQETYLRLLRAPDLGRVDNPEAYLIRVASHVLAEWHQKPPSLSMDDASYSVSLVDTSTPELLLSAEVMQARFNKTLKELPALTRAVVIMRLRDGTAYKEIAKLIGITNRQVKRHLARGYDRLREALEL